LVAVASRHQHNADAFGSEFNARHKHGSYIALTENPDVDVIYVATPHALHHENTMMCLHHRKAVLCEKPFAMNFREAKEMVGLARQNDVFLMEALWTKFMPHYKLVQSIVERGDLGEMKSVLVNFGFAPAAPVPDRLYDPYLGGGTLMDIGIYNVFIALSFLGKPDKIEASMTPADSGVDEQCAVLFKYRNGAMAQLFSSFASNLATEADVCGTKGRIRLGHRFYEPSTTIEYYPGRVDSKQVLNFFKEPGWGYQYEARHVDECLRLGMKESPVMTHADTLLIMETLDEIRRIAGIRYPADERVTA
jgi:predicted dehydrogenase